MKSMRTQSVRLFILHHYTCNFRGRRVSVHRTAPVNFEVVFVTVSVRAHPLVCAVSHKVGVFPYGGRELGDGLGPDVGLGRDRRAKTVDRGKRRRYAQWYRRGALRRGERDEGSQRVRKNVFSGVFLDDNEGASRCRCEFDARLPRRCLASQYQPSPGP